MTKKGHKGRGSVGRNLRVRERYKTDNEFKERKRKEDKIYNEKNRERIKKRFKKWVLKASKLNNKYCLDCNKLLNYRTEGNYCFKCIREKKK